MCGSSSVLTALQLEESKRKMEEYNEQLLQQLQVRPAVSGLNVCSSALLTGPSCRSRVAASVSCSSVIV
jgi:hypothetical protein